MIIWTAQGIYNRASYRSEADLESVILLVQADLFGRNRIYLDVKKRIGKSSGIVNIPDGYLIDLSGSRPRLYLVEVELASHDHLRHIAVQIMQFSTSFESEPHKVKDILFDALRQDESSRARCERYVSAHGFRNTDHLLESMVYEGAFSVIVVIDQMPEELESILLRKFEFGVEVLELARYQNEQGECIYHFEPFLAEVSPSLSPTPEQRPEREEPAGPRKEAPKDIGDIDTIVVAAHEDSFRKVFIGENRWYTVRIDPTVRPQLKYIAVYRVDPIRAITHIAPIKSIKPWEDSGKLVINFAEPAKEIGPIELSPGSTEWVRGPKYTTREALEHAKTLDDLWGPSVQAA